MNAELTKVALQQRTLFIPSERTKTEMRTAMTGTTSVLVANAAKLGYMFSEDLLMAVNRLTPKEQLEILEILKTITGVRKNWTPLVKQWNIPTNESRVDHLITWFANVFKTHQGTVLKCGHRIPPNTFPLERYNGCPFCGTPFKIADLEYEGKGKLKTLELWTENDLKGYLCDLLNSPVALDVNQVNSLKVLLKEFGLPENVAIRMKETQVLVVDSLAEVDRSEEAGKCFTSPQDILRYLWYKHTGFLQIIEPKTIVNRMAENGRNWHTFLDESVTTRIKTKSDLKLKFSREECKRYASWLNGLKMPVEKQCEIMHPKRNMWVRVIRALRLAEYSKRKGFGKLAELLDVFYNEVYEVWQGQVDYFKLKTDAENTFRLLKQRPGLFARSLFSTMLWFGPELTLKHFDEVKDRVSPRLIFTLNMYAEVYFSQNANRSVSTLGGKRKRIPVNQLLQLYSAKGLKQIREMIGSLTYDVIMERFMTEKNENKTVFIEEGLNRIPIAIGERATNVQDLSSALQGTRFKLEGSKVRLFMQWGEGLPAQHLDMDLSCMVAYESKTQRCSYSSLVIPGCKHSGDIQSIPNMVGTAEFIEIDMDELYYNDAKYVSFTCNAYTSGSLSPNMVVGWMNSASPMKITSSGVAYDPTAVQHQVSVSNKLSKGLVFGVLDVQAREIIWLEMDFGGQVVQSLDTKGVELMIEKLDAKLKIGELLHLKAELQGLTVVKEKSQADEVYDLKWANNTAQVSQLFLGE